MNALILVRNTVSHDARVLREAATLRDLGYEVLIAGVVSTTERERQLEIAGNRVVRLTPGQTIRSAVGRVGGAEASESRTRPAGTSPGLRARLRRLVVTVAYYAQGIALMRRTAPDLVHANDYNTMWIGVAAKVLCGSRLVYDAHELWADRNGRPEWRPWLIACEALFVRVADATITTSPGYADAMANRYRVRPPIVVRNIPGTRHGDSAPRDRAKRSPTGASDRPTALAVYLGGLMPGRGLEQAIRALALAPELRLRLIGPGRDSYTATLRAYAEEAGVADRVELRPPVPPESVIEAIADSDLGLMLIQPACRSYELTLPNKLFEYAAAGVPILASDLTVIGPLVRAEEIGESVPATDVELIAGAMRRLADPTANAAMRIGVRAFARRVTWEREQIVLERVYRGDGAGRG